MSHDHNTESDLHKELDTYGRRGLLDLVKDWNDPYPAPQVITQRLSDGRRIRVVRDDLFEYGTKARAAHAALSTGSMGDYGTIVYVAPRAGWAPISLAKVCNDQGKKLILFCPAAKTPSRYQLTAMELGAELRFVRIAAMPNLQLMAKCFALEHRYLFFPLGLAVPEAVSAIAKVAMGLKLKAVKEVWYVMSTGVLSRGLQVAWPDAKHYGIAVARNLQKGEKGIAQVAPHPLPFLQEVPMDERPPFPSVANYDAKAWSSLVSIAHDNAVLWNVAADPTLPLTKPVPKSDRAWYDMTDLERA